MFYPSKIRRGEKKNKQGLQPSKTKRNARGQEPKPPLSLRNNTRRATTTTTLSPSSISPSQYTKEKKDRKPTDREKAKKNKKTKREVERDAPPHPSTNSSPKQTERKDTRNTKAKAREGVGRQCVDSVDFCFRLCPPSRRRRRRSTNNIRSSTAKKVKKKKKKQLQRQKHNFSE